MNKNTSKSNQTPLPSGGVGGGLRKIRITLATIFLLGLTLLFLDFTGTAHTWLGWMAKTQALEAILALNVVVIVALVALTLIFGRIYCSVICPLGIMQDIFGWIGKKAKKNRYTYSKERKWLRYIVLALFVVACVAGMGVIIQLLAPYSAFGRIVSSLLQPLYQTGNNLLADMAEKADSYTFYSVDVWIKSLPVLIIAAVTLVTLIVLAWRGGRTYCNTICPVGTVLSFLARHSLLKIRFDAEKCKNCSLCTKNCKASCIDYKTHTVDYSRCVVCGDCIAKCKFGALKYTSKTSSTSETNKTNETSAGRRSFLVGTALVTTAAIAGEKHVKAGLAAIGIKQAPDRQTPVTPPGSLSASHMAHHCTGCQLCVAECPNNVLRPSTGLMTLMQPVMSFERGYCRPECTHCSQVCPAGAILSVSKEEKQNIQTGHAVVTPNLCFMAQGKEDECSNCMRHCPAGAITTVDLTEALEKGLVKREDLPKDFDEEFPTLMPVVDANLCTGCGACEYVCPVRPLSAIHVEGYTEHQHRGAKPAEPEQTEAEQEDIPCIKCGMCMPCPYGIDIPTLFTHHNKMKGEPARHYLISLDRQVPRSRQADHCIKCGRCISERHCPQDIRIPKQMERLSKFTEELKRKESIS